MKLNSFFKSGLRRSVSFLLMVLILVSACSVSVSAVTMQEDPCDTYTYWAAPGTQTPSVATPMYQFKRQITGASLGVSGINEAADIYTDESGMMYVMDSGNGRVLVINSDYTLNTVISNLSYKGTALDFAGAQGVFVTKNKTVYIADTENSRIIVTNLQNQVSKVLTLPQADVIPKNFIYRPTKIAIDSRGYTYVVSDGSYYGALLYMPDGTFSGFYGSNSVQSSVLDIFTRIYEAIFVSDVKKENAEKTLPYAFTDITVDKEDFIYTATGAVSAWVSNVGQLRKLSPGGTNVLKDKTASKVTSAEDKNFSDGAGVNYITAAGHYSYKVSDLRSMDVDENGFMYAVCGTFGHIFIYDQECNMLTSFGGGNSGGAQNGTFSHANSIEVNKVTQDVLVVDKMNGNITVFKPTEYGALVKKAQKLTNAGSYTDAKPYWEQVLTYDRSNQLAYRGLAKAALLEENYKTCLDYAKKGFDQDTYATAYKFVRNEYIGHNFTWIFILAVLVVGALIAFLVYTNKHEVRLIKNKKVQTMFNCIVHPFDGAKQIRYYGQGSIFLASVVLVLYFIASALDDMYGGFMYNIFIKAEYNVAFVFCMTIVAYLLWTVVNWAIATLFSGKGRIKDIYIVTCYALIPMVLYEILTMILTNVVVPEEILIISVVQFVCQALFFIMLCVGIMTSHEFGFFKFLILSAVTLLGMFICVFIAFMIFVLVQQMFSFVETIYKEVAYR